MRKVMIILTLSATAWAGVARSTVKVGRVADGRTTHVTVRITNTSAKAARKAASAARNILY